MMSATEGRKFKRVVLKLSGEALRENGSRENISPEIVEDIAIQIEGRVSERTADRAGGGRRKFLARSHRAEPRDGARHR